MSGLDFGYVHDVLVVLEFSDVSGQAGRQQQTKLSLSGLTRESTGETDERWPRGPNDCFQASFLASLGQMQRYRDQQQGIYEDDVSTTRIDQLTQDIGRSFNETRECVKKLYLMQAESLEQLRRHKAGPAETEAALTQVVSRAMRARIDGAMAQSDLGMALWKVKMILKGFGNDY